MRISSIVYRARNMRISGIVYRVSSEEHAGMEHRVSSEEHADIEHRVSGIERHCYAGFVFPNTLEPLLEYLPQTSVMSSSETQGQIVGRAGNWGERKRRRRGKVSRPPTICPWVSPWVSEGAVMCNSVRFSNSCPLVFTAVMKLEI